MQGAASIIGVTEPYAFRDAVLENVELLKQQSSSTSAQEPDSTTASTGNTQLQLLSEIRDILTRIENQNRPN